MNACAKAGCLGLAWLAIAVPAVAQFYPMPSSAPVPCETLGCDPAGTPTAPISSPIVRHVGRYLDSTQVRDMQGPIRTFRARRVAIVPERDRVYMRIGSTFAVYRLSTFFSQDLGTPLASVVAGTRIPPEQYLRFFDFVYPEQDDDWITEPADGQDRLGEGFDWDDRGYVYLPYKVFGWGIYRDTNPSYPLQFERQYQAGSLYVTAATIISVRDGDAYYALVADDSGNATVVEVTQPKYASLVRNLSLPIGHFAKAQANGQQITAVVDWKSNYVMIFRPSSLVNGVPDQVFKPSGGAKFKSVTSDGTRFFAAEVTPKGSATNAITIIAPSPDDPASFVDTRIEVEGAKVAPERITWSQGTLAVIGIGVGGKIVNLYRVAGDSLRYVDLGPFLMQYYNGYYDPASGLPVYASPGQCTVGDTAIVHEENGKGYLLVAMTGLGDVYEIPPRPEPPSAPDAVTATADASTSVTVEWAPVERAARYDVYRKSALTDWETIGSTTAPPFVDSSAAPATAYLYAVAAFDAEGGSSPTSPPDLATTVTFTDACVAGVTPVRGTHLMELRAGVAAIRSLAGLGSYAWTDEVIVPGETLVKAQHVAELLAPLAEARAALGLAGAFSASSAVTAGAWIEGAHVTALRGDIR